MTSNSSPSDEIEDKRGLKIPRFVLEFITIVFGVLLGLWLNGWQSNIKDQKFVDKSVSVMMDELDRNFTIVETSRKYHLRLLPELVEARDAQRNGRDVPEFEYYGFGTSQTSTAAYQTALSSGVFAKLDPEYSTKIANAYVKLSAIKETDGRYKASLSNSQDRFLELMPFAFSDLLYAEDAALKAISDVTNREAPKRWTEESDIRPY